MESDQKLASYMTFVEEGGCQLLRIRTFIVSIYAIQTSHLFFPLKKVPFAFKFTKLLQALTHVNSSPYLLYMKT